MNPRDLYNMTNEELVDLIKKQKRNIQRRMRKLENTSGGKLSPSYRKSKKEKLDKQQVPNFNKSEDKEYTREQAIRQAEKNERRLKNKTFTPKGWDKVRSDFQNRIGEKMSARTEKKFWDTYNTIMDEYPELSQAIKNKNKSSEDVQKEVWDIINNGDKRRSTSTMIDDVRKVLDTEYERQQEEKQEQEESSQYHTFYKSSY